jgi:hypothetical protein
LPGRLFVVAVDVNSNQALSEARRDGDRRPRLVFVLPSLPALEVEVVGVARRPFRVAAPFPGFARPEARDLAELLGSDVAALVEFGAGWDNRQNFPLPGRVDVLEEVAMGMARH